MIAVIFEVWPHAEKRQAYLDLAKDLRSVLEKIDGFVSVERFESLTEPGKLLSISVFRDEAALTEWRKTMAHRSAQKKGRDDYFENYRLRVAHVLRDYGKTERDEAPVDSRAKNG